MTKRTREAKGLWLGLIMPLVNISWIWRSISSFWEGESIRLDVDRFDTRYQWDVVIKLSGWWKGIRFFEKVGMAVNQSLDGCWNGFSGWVGLGLT